MDRRTFGIRRPRAHDFFHGHETLKPGRAKQISVFPDRHAEHQRAARGNTRCFKHCPFGDVAGFGCSDSDCVANEAVISARRNRCDSAQLPRPDSRCVAFPDSRVRDLLIEGRASADYDSRRCRGLPVSGALLSVAGSLLLDRIADPGVAARPVSREPTIRVQQKANRTLASRARVKRRKLVDMLRRRIWGGVAAFAADNARYRS